MKPRLSAQGGQLIIEAILLIVALMAVTFTVGSYFKSQEIVKKLISGPWVSLAGMIQNGEWGSPDSTDVLHPNAHGRHVSIQGQSP